VNHFAYCRRALARASAPFLVAGCGVALLGALGCKAGVSASLAGSGGSGNTVGQGGSGGSKGSGGIISITGDGGGGGDIVVTGDAGPSDAAGCQTADVMFTQTNPTVYLLVDRSGSMFHCLTGNTGDAVCADMTNTSWYNLKSAIEQVLPQLDSQVRFGFSTVYGTNPTSGGMCPSIQGMLTNDVPPALNNAGNIATLYDGLAFPANSTQAGIKFESPISESLGNVAQALASDTSVGSKYIMLITDGQPDYCDDSNSLCAPDSVVYQLQKAYTAGIPTIVFGIQTALFDLAPGVLQAFANAGAGEPTLAPVKVGGSPSDFYDQCNSVSGWAADLTASGKPNARGTTLGNYMTTMGPTMPYTPSASDKNMLVTQLSKALSGVRSCTFDLGALNFQIDTTKLSEAQVYLLDSSNKATVLPLDPKEVNGWYMTDITTNSQGDMTATTLQLFGDACTQLSSPNTVDIKFKFPCDLRIVIDKP
jgi:hypothetical protein